jgi:hypothetical protein
VDDGHEHRNGGWWDRESVNLVTLIRGRTTTTPYGALGQEDPDNDMSSLLAGYTITEDLRLASYMLGFDLDTRDCLQSPRSIKPPVILGWGGHFNRH